GYDLSSFFFQADDGIRDGHVTGVQTCALPIWLRAVRGRDDLRREARPLGVALEDRGLGRILDEEEDVGVRGLKALDLGGERRRAGPRREVEHDLEAEFRQQLVGDLTVVLAEEVVAGEDGDGLEVRR